MLWETPTLIEIDMNAEIGGYQGEEPDPTPWPSFIQDEDGAEQASEG
jgi:hypothetical protein